MDDLEVIADLEYGKAIERMSVEMHEKMLNAVAGKSGKPRELARFHLEMEFAERACKEYGRIWQDLLEAKNGGHLTRENVDFITQKVIGIAAARKSNLAAEFPERTSGVQSEVGTRLDDTVASIRRDLEIRIRRQQVFAPKKEVNNDVAEEAQTKTGFGSSDKLAIVLTCLSGVMAIMLFLLEKTPATIVVSLVVMTGLAVYPILRFARGAKSKVLAMVCLIVVAVAFALQAWPRKNTLKLSGIVTDEKSYVGIPEVNVSVVGRGAVHDAITDTRGQFVLQLSDDLKAGDDTVKLRFAKRGYVTADYNQPVVSGYAILISLVQATKDDDRGETTDAVGWITYLVNYGRTGDGAFWTGYQLSPTQDLRAPIEIRLTFSGRIIGEPRIQLVQEKLYPVSWSFLGQEGNTLTFKISDPPLRSSSILQMTVTSNKPDDAMLTAVTCVECARR